MVGEQVVAALIGNVDDVLEPAGFVIVAAWLEEVEHLWELVLDGAAVESAEEHVRGVQDLDLIVEETAGISFLRA